MAPADAPNYQADASAAYKFLVGWIIVLVLLSVANRTRLGHVIIYYSLSLMIVLVCVTQAPQIVGFLSAIGSESPA